MVKEIQMCKEGEPKVKSEEQELLKINRRELTVKSIKGVAKRKRKNKNKWERTTMSNAGKWGEGSKMGLDGWHRAKDRL